MTHYSIKWMPQYQSYYVIAHYDTSTTFVCEKRCFCDAVKAVNELKVEDNDDMEAN